MNEHRMVFSISKTQTVLWDQIKYSGNPKDFAWVLPVHVGAKLEASHEEFMAALDAYTQPVITGPQPPPSKPSAFSCGSSSTGDFASAPPGDHGVNIVSQQVVGPYEVVTLHATDSKALEAWLKSHSYVIQPEIQPTIDAYVKEQFDFIALRLLPGKGIAAMEPVRVVTQGADTTLPLRMVAAGVGQKVGVLLYVIGEGRYHTSDFHDVTIEDSQLVWNNSTASSNYSTLADALMTSGDSKGVLTEFAGHASKNDFSRPPNGGFLSFAYFDSLAAAYKNAVDTTLATKTNCDSFGDASINGPDTSTPDAATSDADVDGGAADAQVTDASTTPASDPCRFDDFAVATSGMKLSDVWVTRMRMHLPVSALAADLHLAATQPQALVSPYHQIATSESSGCSEASGNSNTWTGIALGALGAVLVARRRKRPNA